MKHENRFEPKTINAKVGETVTWKNNNKSVYSNIW